MADIYDPNAPQKKAAVSGAAPELGSLNNAVGGTSGGDPNASLTNGATLAVPGSGGAGAGVAGGNMDPFNGAPIGAAPGTAPDATAGGDQPPVAGWVRYGNGGWAPPEIVAGATQGAQGATASGAAPQTLTPPPAGTSDSDIYHNALLQQMGQSTTVSADDPNVKAQLDPYRNEAKRMMDSEIRGGAEGAFAKNQDYGTPERVAAAERAGESAGVKASDLVGQELQARRAEIQSALTQFGARLSDQEKNALTQKLAEMDAAIQRSGQDIQRAGLAQTGQLGQADINLRQQLGLGGLNNDLIRTLTQDKQAGNTLGATLGMDSAHLNQQAMLALLEQ